LGGKKTSKFPPTDPQSQNVNAVDDRFEAPDLETGCRVEFIGGRHTIGDGIMKLTRWVLVASVCMAGTLISGARALSAQGTITGRVTASEGGDALADARVMVVGTSVAATSGTDGRYTLRNVPAGAQQVRVLRVGYQEKKQPASVAAGQSATLDFTLNRAIVQLQEIVTTATGEQRKVELGNSVATLGDVSKRVEQQSITTMADLLVAKAPGMTVLQGSYSMTAPTIRIRGLNSVSLGNAPIFIIDGVRMNTGTFAGGNSNPPASFINDIDPQTIEDIEIVKGPSAATLYGTDAANGVVVITTKRGRAGATRWTWSAEQGAVDDRSHFLDTYMIFGHTATNPAVVRCVLIQVSAKTCIPDSTSHLNPMMMDSLTPLNIGHRNAYNVQTSGGNDAVRFFVSGGIENETGPSGMPDFSIRRLDSLRTTIRDEWLHPEAYQKENIQANLNATVSPTFNLAVSSQFLKVNQRLPQVNNNFYSSPYQSMMSPGFSHPGPGYKGIGTLGEQLHGYNGFVPSEINQDLTQDDIQGLIGNVQSDWRPFAWMQNSGNVGLDYRNRVGYSLCRFGECPYFGDPKQVGSVSSSTNNLRNFSAKVTSVSSWQAKSYATLQTSFGSDYTNQEDDNTNSNSQQLPPGGQTVGQGAIQGGGNQPSRASKTLGLFVQEQLALRDRMFIILAVRSDQNSAFGVNFQRVAYPKASLSWILSDESFFPHYNWLNTFRLRSAYGSSGVNPGSTAGLITFSSSIVNVPPAPNNSLGTDTPGLVAGALGNPNLKPETSSEFEGGFESHLFNRVNIDFTYYSKKTKDALINQPIAPSAAAPVTSVLRNLGSVANSGVELTVTSQLVDRRAFGWDMTVGASHLSNRLISLGNDAAGLPNKTIGTGTSRDSVGLPLNALFYRTYTYADANNDGIITQSEVTVNPLYQYVGYSIPRDVVSIASGFDVFNRKLRINVSGDYKGGLQVFNSAAQFQCAQNLACKGASDQTASLADQAANVANRYATGADLKGILTPYGYLQSGQFWRLREVSGTYTLPTAISSRLAHARDAQLTFAARNLKVWTKYQGSDPEETAGTGDTQATFGNAGPRTYFVGRLVLHY
jgi:TonB-linked SusC/RagA family outer membrane protein